jgi:hypothetical protein
MPVRLLRFAVHLVLFYFEEGVSGVEHEPLAHSCSQILLEYIKHLIDSKHVPLIHVNHN